MSPFQVLQEGDAELGSMIGDLDPACSQLRAAQLVGQDQERLRREVLDFCDRHDDALHRSCLEGHLTGSAMVVDPVAGASLLIHHAKLKRWLQPGGHADGDANLAHVAWREATEETGLTGLRVVVPAIDIDVHTIPARLGEPEHLHLDLRHLVLVGDETDAVPNHEVTAARWMLPDAPEIRAGGGELYRAVSRAIEVAASLLPR